MRRALIAAIFLLSMHSQALAQQVDLYECNLPNARGFISEEMIFIHDPQRNEFLVYDGAIHMAEGEPKVVQVAANDDKKPVLSWKLLLPDSPGKVARVTYRLAYYKKDSLVTVRMEAPSYTNKEYQRGKCRRSKRSF